MDLFEDAAQRLAKDQSKLRARRQVAVSAKAQREAAFRKKQQERLRQERQAKQKLAAYQEKYMTSCDRSLKVRQLSSNGSCLQLQATSIWGEGDKIALPPSVLEYLTSSQTVADSTTGSSPWMFRIGIRNPHYHFPQSILLQTMKPPSNDEEEDDTMHDDDSDDDEMDGTFNSKMDAAYLEELSHKYLAYTHGTVVEFTQDEGHVGLPAPIAAALLNSAGNKNGNNNHQDFQIPTKRTVDPSSSKITHSAEANDDNNNNNNHNDMGMEEEEEKTPGHIAYGAFEVPDMPVEITLVKLPKGKGCTLTPTPEAIHNGFYNLRDIKLVLEQSLVRTRATLSVNDVVHTWHRGVKFDLVVTKVIPSTYQAITSIDTDIEVEFGVVENDAEQQGGQQGNSNATAAAANTNSLPLSDTNFASAGRTLASSSSSSPSPNDEKRPSSSATATVSLDQLLRPEPPADQKQGVCTVQIKADSATGRRRFDVTKSTIQDLFQFASHVSQLDDATQFRLVTRFPRRVISLQDNTSVNLADAGIQAGQELLMVERM